MVMDFMWSEDKYKLMYEKAFKDVDSFFYVINEKKELGLTYRENQHKFARDIMDAIKENRILLVQAGVGIGKSMGYLVPIFSSFNNVSNFEKIIISTSSIALQQQLLTDINYVSKLLDVKLKVEVAKGINNYVCLKRVYDLYNRTRNHNHELKNLLIRLEYEINQKQTIDKSKLSKISEDVWKEIQLTNRNLCNNCPYSRCCLFRHHVNKVGEANIIVTNHSYFVSAARSIDVFKNADIYVFDEAHALEESIRNINESELRLTDIKKDIFYFYDNGYIRDDSFYSYILNFKSNLTNLFNNIKDNALYTFNNSCRNQAIKITDCDKIPIDGKKFSSELKSIIKSFKFVINYVSQCNYVSTSKEAIIKLSKLTKYCNLFYDLSCGSNDSKCIYWASFFKKDKIDLGYVLKNDHNAIKNIFGRGIPVICTSATMLDANGGYSYFKEGLHLNDMQLSDRSIVDGKVYDSPFDYEKNSIFYYDTTVSNPQNYNKYIRDLIDRIKNILLITEGKALVLFTAKSTMKTVYNALSKENLGYNLIMQDQCDNSILCKKFETDINSCLFATGSFWEGIDIKGEALSNVIITRLPFPVVDAIMEDKASKFSVNESFRMVYLNDMVKKLAQGCGRLIRNNNDKGIICCLDPRVIKYLDAIKNCTPYVNYTNNIDDIISFSDKYIRKLSKKK